MRLRRSCPFSHDDDSIALDSTDLSLRPLSAWRLSTSHCAPLLPNDARWRFYNSWFKSSLLALPFPLDNDSTIFDLIAFSLRPLFPPMMTLHPLFNPTTILQFSTQWLFPCTFFRSATPDVSLRSLFRPMALDVSLHPLFCPTMTLQLSTRWLFPCAPLPPIGSRRLFAPLFRPSDLDVSLRPSSAHRI